MNKSFLLTGVDEIFNNYISSLPASLTGRLILQKIINLYVSVYFPIQFSVSMPTKLGKVIEEVCLFV